LSVDPPSAWGYTPLYGGPSPRIPPYYRSKCQNRGDNTLSYAKKILGKNCPFFEYLLETNFMNRSFSKIKHIQESNSRLEKRLLDEQGFDPKKDYLSKGYIDVTDGFMKDTYVLQIADGDYKCDGSGYSFRIVTNDGKETGYVVIIKSGVRGMITGPVKVVNNGVGLNIGTWGRDFDSLLYNEKLNQVKLVK